MSLRNLVGIIHVGRCILVLIAIDNSYLHLILLVKIYLLEKLPF